VFPRIASLLREFTKYVPEQVPRLLWKISTTDVKAADAKRLNQAASAGAFQILDFERPESADTLEMILRASMHPVMLQQAEGHRCIARFFDLGPALVRSLLNIVRSQIQMGKQEVLEAYGVYKIFHCCFEAMSTPFMSCISCYR
jgi:hypothetical protein